MALNDLRVHLGTSLEDLISWLKRLLPVEFRVKGLEPSSDKFSVYLFSLNNHTDELNSKFLKQIIPEELFYCTKPLQDAGNQDEEIVSKAFIQDVMSESRSTQIPLNWEDYLACVNLQNLLQEKASRVPLSEFNNGLLYALWKVNNLIKGDDAQFVKWLSLTSPTVMKEKDYFAMAKAASAIDKHLQSYPEEINRLIAPIIIRPGDTPKQSTGPKVTPSGSSERRIGDKTTNDLSDDDVILEEVVISGSQRANTPKIVNVTSEAPKNLSSRKTARVLPQLPNENIGGIKGRFSDTNSVPQTWLGSNTNREISEPIVAVNSVPNQAGSPSLNNIPLIRFSSVGQNLNANQFNGFNGNFGEPILPACSNSAPNNFIPPIHLNSSSQSNDVMLVQPFTGQNTIRGPLPQPFVENQPPVRMQNPQQTLILAQNEERPVQSSAKIPINRLPLRPQLPCAVTSSGVPLIPVLNSGGYMTMFPFTMKVQNISYLNSNGNNTIQGPTLPSISTSGSNPNELASKVCNLERQLEEIQKQNSKLLEMNQKLMEKALVNDNTRERLNSNEVDSDNNFCSTSVPSASSSDVPSKQFTAAASPFNTPNPSCQGRGEMASSNLKRIIPRDVKKTRQSFEDALNYNYKK